MKLARTRKTKPLVLLAASLLAIAGTTVVAAPAHAGVVDGHCAFTETATLSPAGTTTPQTINVAGEAAYSLCTVGPTATGTSSRTITGASCSLSFAFGVFASYTETVTWLDDGTTSTLYFSSEEATAGTFTNIGVVTAGRHAGDSVVKSLELTPQSTIAFLECARGASSVSSFASVGTIEFTGV